MTERLRIDKWLWHARFFKSRSMAADIVAQGEVTVNGVVVRKPSQALKPGDSVGFPMGRDRRLVRVVALGERRGPAVEAQALYEDLVAPRQGLAS